MVLITDLGDVEETSRTSDQSTTREVQLRYGLEASLIQSSSTVGNTLTIFEDVGEEWVVLHSLEPLSVLYTQSRMRMIITHLELLIR